jgi:uncharacterized protein YndB with AHSA1/START domain
MSRSDQKVETTDRELVLTRTFDAPRELVFTAYSSCEHLRNWWGPRSWPMVECTLDFRVGGVWHYCLRGPDEGDESWGRAVYDEIVEPARIAYTDAFSDAEGNVNEAMPRTRSTVEFDELDGSTRLTLRATYPSAEDLQQVLDMGMVAGMTETLDRLDEHLAEAGESRA